MIQESVSIHKSTKETNSIIRKVIPQIFGKITRTEATRIYWEYEVGIHIIECETQLNTKDDHTEVITYAHSKTRKSSSKPIINKFHKGLLDSNNITLRKNSKPASNRIKSKQKNSITNKTSKYPTQSQGQFLYKIDISFTMNKKSLIIGIGILMVLLFIGHRSYNSVENENAKYRDSKNDPTETIITKNKDVSSHRQSQEKPIFNYKSLSNDLENEIEILQTNNEISYHTFNFNTNTIKFKSQSENGTWKNFEFVFSDFRDLPNRKAHV